MVRNSVRAHFRTQEEFFEELNHIEADIKQELAELEPIDLDAVFEGRQRVPDGKVRIRMRLSWATIVALHCD